MLKLICYGLFIMECQQVPTAPVDAVTFCQAYQPIYWSAADTRETKRQADRMNRVWKRICSPQTQR